MACNDTKDTELLDAVRSGNFERFKVLLAEGANIRVTGYDRNTLLHLSQDKKITKELLRRGLSVHATNSWRELPLNFVVKGGGGKTVVEELLKYGADVSYIDRRGNTPLHIALKASYKCKEVITYLVKYGSNIYTKNREHRLFDNHSSPLQLGVFRKLLVKYRIIKNFNEYQKEVALITEDGSFRDPDFVNDCVAEILQMKTHLLQGDISLFDVVENSFSFESLFSKPKISLQFVPSSCYSVPRLYVQCSNKLSMKLKYMDFSTQYPIYNEVILDAIKPYVARTNLLDKLKMVDFYTELDTINQLDLTANEVDRTVQVGLLPNKMNIKANPVEVMADAQANPSDVKTKEVDAGVNPSDVKTNEVDAGVSPSDVKTNEVDASINQSDVKTNQVNEDINPSDVKTSKANADVDQSDAKNNLGNVEFEQKKMKNYEVNAEVNNASDVKINKVEAVVNQADVEVTQVDTEEETTILISGMIDDPEKKTNQVDVDQSDVNFNQANEVDQSIVETNDADLQASQADGTLNQAYGKATEVDVEANQVEVDVKAYEVDKADLKANQAVVKRVTLNYLCVYSISEYLSNEDLLNFIIAAYVLNNSKLVNDGEKPDATRALEDSVGNPAKRARLE